MEVIGVEASGARSMRAAFDRGYPIKLEEIDTARRRLLFDKIVAAPAVAMRARKSYCMSSFI